MIEPKELLFAVDENNRPLMPVPRNEAHAKGIWHRSIDVWVLDGDKILCQKRSMLKDTNPGIWEPCFGGHLGPKDTNIKTAQKELHEEMGILLPKNRFKRAMTFKYSYKDRITNALDREFLEVFLVSWSGDISKLKLEESEVEKVDWYLLDSLGELIGKDDHWVFVGYEQELIKKLKGGEL